jgi:hypothetical protein
LHKLQRALRFIDEHIAAAIPVADLAATAHMSLFHFARMFKEATGVPPHRYITSRRVDRAKSLLTETDLPLVDVAAEAEGLLVRRREIELMVQSLLKGRLFADMQASPRCRREMYVGAQFDDLTLWGYVDAVFVNDAGALTLVDFKTDTLVTSAAELARRYQPQMSGYVAALQKATGMTVSEAWLAVAQTDGTPATEVRVDIIDAAELLTMLR